jgi:hypothetical protein
MGVGMGGMRRKIIQIKNKDMARVKKLEKLYKKYYFRLQGLLFDPSTENIRKVVETHINFALEKNKAFDALYSSKQYASTQGLVRMLAECCMRAYGHLYNDSRTSFRIANKSVRGIALQKIPQGGKQLTDAVLRERIKEVYPIVSESYEMGNDNVHVGGYYYDNYLSGQTAEELRERMIGLNDVLLEILTKIITNLQRLYPFTMDAFGQEMIAAEMEIITSDNPDDEFNAIGWLSLARIKQRILDIQWQFSELYRHHMQKAKALGEDEKDVMNIIMQPIMQELDRYYPFAKMIGSIEAKYGEEAVAAYKATWLKIRIENTPEIGLEITRAEPIYQLHEIRAEYDEEWLDRGKKILEDIAAHPEKYPEEFVKAVIPREVN